MEVGPARATGSHGAAQATGLRRQVLAHLDAASDHLNALSRDLHAHPEYGYAEHESVRRILDVLRGRPGIAIEEGTAGLPTAFRAWTGSSDGPAIGIICEYDAVPGLGHGCGHNLIAASAVGVLLALEPIADGLPGRVVVIGSPAEEGGGGKIVMVQRGAYDGLAAVLQTHPCDRHRLSGPTIGMAGLKIEFYGRAAHAGSANDRGINALDAVVQLFNAVNAFRQQMRDGARIHGVITHGGTRPNTIPDYTAAEIWVRAPDEDYLGDLLARVEACAQGAAVQTGCRASVERPPLSHYPAMKLNRTLSHLLGATLSSLGEDVEGLPPGFEGYANDVGAVSRVAPAALLNYKIGPIGLAEHSKAFMEAAVSDEGHRGMVLASKTMALTALDLLLDPGRQDQVRQEFERDG
jgi:amidohydrolase